MTLSTSIEDKLLPPGKGVIRCETLFHLMIFEPQSDGKKIVQSYTQCDPNMPVVAKSLMNRVVIQKLFKWYRNLVGYMDKLCKDR